MAEDPETVQEIQMVVRRLINRLRERVRELSARNDLLDPNDADETLDLVTELLTDHIESFSRSAQKHADEYRELKAITSRFDQLDNKVNKRINGIDQKLDTIHENVNELKTMMQSIITSRSSQQLFAMSEIYSINIPPSVPEMDKPKQRVGMRSHIWGFLRGLKRGL
ncbi:hypothetical protein KCU98_g3128, partial [Aureobasidium melanogenum]